MEESGATFGGLKLPSAFGGKDLDYGKNPYKPLMRAVPTPPHLEDPGVPAQTLEIEKVLQSLSISNRVEEAANFKELDMYRLEKGPVDHSHPFCSVENSRQ